MSIQIQVRVGANKGQHLYNSGNLTVLPISAGVFVSSWLGGLLLQVGEWLIKKLPLVKHIYSAAKQVSAAVNPSNESTASFRECVIVRHPRQGELAFGFITGQTILAVCSLLPDLFPSSCLPYPHTDLANFPTGDMHLSPFP